MDGFYVAKLKKFSNVTPKPKIEDEEVDAEDSNVTEDSPEENVSVTVTKSEGGRKRKSGSFQTINTSDDLKDKEETVGKKKRRRKKKKKKNANTNVLDMSSSTVEDSALDERKPGENKLGKKRKLQQKAGEGDESSPPKAKHLDVTPSSSPSKRRRLKKRQKTLAALNQVPAATDMSNNLETPVKNVANEVSIDNSVESPNKGPTVTANKLSRSARRRLKRKQRALESAGQKVLSNVTVQSNFVGDKKKKKKKKHNNVESENSSSPTKKLKVDEGNHIKKITKSHSQEETEKTEHQHGINKTPLGKKKHKKHKKRPKENSM